MFPENGFNFITQKSAKNWKSPFSNAYNIHFRDEGSLKEIF